MKPMRRAIVFCLLLLGLQSLAQTDTITQRIFLIGDAGEIFGPNGTHPVIDWLEKNVDWNDTRNNAVFLGDSRGSGEDLERSVAATRQTRTESSGPFSHNSACNACCALTKSSRLTVNCMLVCRAVCDTPMMLMPAWAMAPVA